MCVKIEVGLDARLQLLEDVLHLAADVREEAVAEPVHDARRRAPPPRGTPPRSPAPRCSRSPVAPSTTHVTSSSGRARVSASSVAPQPISMSSACAAEREDAADRRVARRERELEHQRRRLRTGAPTLRQGARPLSASASSRCLSLIVSIGSQKPS